MKDKIGNHNGKVLSKKSEPVLDKNGNPIHKLLYTITYKSRLTQKKLHKKNDAIFSIYGKNGINP